MSNQRNISENFPYASEQLRVSSSGNEVKARLNVIVGREGEFVVILSPSVNVSGYGKTEKEAREDFKYNMSIFCEDLYEMSVKNRKAHLKELGWIEDKFAKKNFSKAFINNNGQLEGLENVEIMPLEFA